MNYKGLLQTYDRSCYLTASTKQDIPATTYTAIDFDTEVYDTDNLHESVTNPSRITIVTAGKYMFNAGLRMTEPITGNVLLELRHNNSTKSRLKVIAPTNVGLNASLDYDMAVGEYIQMFCWHDHSEARETNITNTFLQCHLLPPENVFP